MFANSFQKEKDRLILLGKQEGISEGEQIGIQKGEIIGLEKGQLIKAKSLLMRLSKENYIFLT